MPYGEAELENEMETEGSARATSHPGNFFRYRRKW